MRQAAVILDEQAGLLFLRSTLEDQVRHTGQQVRNDDGRKIDVGVIAMFVERHKRLRQANETILAYQALSNEAEIWRRIGFGQLDAQAVTFQSDTAIIAPLAPYTASIHVDTPRADVKSVTFTIRWASTQREAKLSIVRADTGGNGLW